MVLFALASNFKTAFSREAQRYFFSPGRVNLLGEHTDYNGGHVFPCAINYGIYGAVSKRKDRLVRLYSKNFPDQDIVEFTLDELEHNPHQGWVNYTKALLHSFKKNGCCPDVGFDLLISGNIPNGAGLFSSASLLVLIGETLNKLYDFKIDRLKMIKAVRMAENEYMGVCNGMMNHFATAMGKSDHGILLDCHTLSYEYVPLNLQPYKLLIMNTNKRHEQASEKTIERRDECEHALRHLQGAINIQSLGDLTTEQLENFNYLIPTNVLRKRAKHVISENERTLTAVKELKKGNYASFGKLMNQSHISLQNDYGVTGVELDTLVEAAWQQQGVLGAKMTGSGFGGCAFALVHESKIDQVIEHVGEIYRKRIGYNASFFVASVEDGVRELNIGAVR